MESNGGSVTLSATLVTITTVTPHNGTPTSTKTESDITKDVIWYCNDVEYGTNKVSYSIGQNPSTSARTFKFEAVYTDVDDCRTQPIVVIQKKVEEVWGRIEITLRNSYGPNITLQQSGAISIVEMRQESNLGNVRTLANGDFDIATYGYWKVHAGLKIDSIYDNNRTCIVSINRDITVLSKKSKFLFISTINKTV